ncbi:MAG: VCBS repeat-containing protein [Candidatus Eisenbacteria bacterium]
MQRKLFAFDTRSGAAWIAAFAALLSAAILAPSASLAGIAATPLWTLDGSQNGANLGWSVSTAGDVNGDGYADVIVGEPLADALFGNNNGRARVYQGGPNGPGDSADWSAFGAGLSQFGYSVSTAGDVNGDGYDDVIIGAPYYSNGNDSEGAAWLYLGSSGGVNGGIAWSREGGQDGARLGHCVSTAGDVNGDGYDDVIVASPFYTSNLTEQGRVQIFLGGPDSLASSPHRTIYGSGAGDAFGWRVATAGDVNGDGYDDVLVSAVYYEGLLGPTNEGAVYCYHGSAAGVDDTADWLRSGVQADEYFGSGLAFAGDTNGDGFSDILIGAGAYDNGQVGEGHVVLYLGSATGLAGTPHREWESNQSDTYLGDAVATAGDVNADGFADVILGEPNLDAGQEDEGSVLAYCGSPTGPGSSIFAIDSDEAFAGLGWAVATAGDVDGDGRSDILVGAPFADAGGSNRGRVQIFAAFADHYGNADFTAENNQAGAGMGHAVGMADVNGDGYSDLLGAAWFYDAGETNEGRAYCWLGGYEGISNPADWYRDGNQTNAFYGHVIASAGDVNGDGYDDVAVTAPGYDDVLANEGKVWVHHGSATGLSADPSWSARGQQADSDFGWSAASAGDVNGDGYGDLIIGKPDHDNPQTDEGAALLYLGSAGGLQSAPVIGWEGNQDGANAGFSVACAGDVNGDGYSDVISGAPLYDTAQGNEGVVFVFFGSPGDLDPSPSQTIRRGFPGMKFGISIDSASDVNGDGYSDIVVGASGYTNGQDQEGAVYVYHGGPAGVDGLHDFAFEPNIAGAYLGEKVAGIGDINADGYSDIAAAAPHYGPNFEGRIYVFAGSPSGIVSTPFAILNGGDGRFGAAIAGYGDIDSDGFPDLVAGAPDATNGSEGEGLLALLYGNRTGASDFGPGAARRLHMRQPDDGSRLALLGRSEEAGEMRIRMLGRSAFGRGRVRASYQFSPLGETWSGPTLTTNWVDSGEPIPGQGSRVGINEIVSGLAGDTPYHWRVRFESESPYFSPTPWLSLAGNGPVDADFRTAGAPTGVEATDVTAGAGALDLRFERVFPNPLRDDTRLRFYIPSPGAVRLTVHDVSGRRVATLLDGHVEAGTHEIAWAGGAGTAGLSGSGGGRRLSPGVYFARLQAGDRVVHARLILAR